MDLVEVLGEELAEQVKGKMGDDVILVKEENHVTKSSFNKEREKLKEEKEALETQLKERDSQFNQLKEDSTTSEELKTKIEELQNANEKEKEEMQKKLEQTRLESEIDKRLLKEKARNPKAVKALMSMEEVSIGEDGIEGLDEQLESLKETDDYLFEQEGKKDVGKQTNPGESNDEPDTREWAKKQIDKFGRM